MKIKVSKNVRNALQVVGGAGALTLIVFVTPTIHAPNIVGGLILTAFVYGLTVLSLIGLGVKKWDQITKHLLIATPVALAIGLLGGHFWVGETWQMLLSEQFFVSVAHAAFLIGLLTGSIADAKTR